MQKRNEHLIFTWIFFKCTFCSSLACCRLCKESKECHEETSVGAGSTIVGKYLAFVLISSEEQMDGIYEEEQQRADRLEVDEWAPQNVATELNTAIELVDHWTGVIPERHVAVPGKKVCCAQWASVFACRQTKSICGSDLLRWIFITQLCSHA